MITTDLVVEEVFVDVQCQSKQREQTSSQGNSGMTKYGRSKSDQQLKSKRVEDGY